MNAEHTKKRFYCTLRIRGNGFLCTMSIHLTNFRVSSTSEKILTFFWMYSYAEYTGKWFYRTLSIRVNDLNAAWAYEEMISSLTEHTRKCLKVKYLGRIEHYFQNSRVTGPGVGLGPKFCSKKIPRNRLGMISVIPRKKVLIPRHFKFCGRGNSEARNGTERNRIPRKN